ncbi:MAG: hypothetical protein RLZZ118_1711 [Bacteroidota bacterium]|jgi:hypothetical protein|nr:hypothetical protein [Chitinophagaceae bacterium]
MQQEFHLVSYVATKNSSVQELQHIVAMFAHLEITCAEAKVSEYLNINNYAKKRSVVRCRAILRGNSRKPFEFSYCLN